MSVLLKIVSILRCRSMIRQPGGGGYSPLNFEFHLWGSWETIRKRGRWTMVNNTALKNWNIKFNSANVSHKLKHWNIDHGCRRMPDDECQQLRWRGETSLVFDRVDRNAQICYSHVCILLVAYISTWNLPSDFLAWFPVTINIGR